MLPILYIVVPCYNEQEILPYSIGKLNDKLNKLISNSKLSNNSKIVFVDDGSKDNTWDIIKNSVNVHQSISGIKLSKNYGHQNALIAGIEYSVKFADCIITMDADLQDDIDTIDAFIDKYLQGYEIVYGVREDREVDTFFKRNTALFFYKLMRFLGTEIIYNHADFRLMSKKACEFLLRFEERNLFLRGMIPQIGLKSTVVFYKRKERLAGQTKYPFNKMLKFAIEGITSFSIKPIRIVTLIGLLIFVLSIAAFVYSIVQKIMGKTIPGWTSLFISLWFLGGLQIIAIGLIGEYIGKIYSETKRRPLYFVEDIIDNNEDDKE